MRETIQAPAGTKCRNCGQEMKMLRKPNQKFCSPKCHVDFWNGVKRRSAGLALSYLKIKMVMTNKELSEDEKMLYVMEIIDET